MLRDAGGCYHSNIPKRRGDECCPHDLSPLCIRRSTSRTITSPQSAAVCGAGAINHVIAHDPVAYCTFFTNTVRMNLRGAAEAKGAQSMYAHAR